MAMAPIPLFLCGVRGRGDRIGVYVKSVGGIPLSISRGPGRDSTFAVGTDDLEFSTVYHLWRSSVDPLSSPPPSPPSPPSPPLPPPLRRARWLHADTRRRGKPAAAPRLARYEGKVVMVHNNWVIGHEAKYQRFVEYGLWLVGNTTFPTCGGEGSESSLRRRLEYLEQRADRRGACAALPHEGIGLDGVDASL